MDFVAHRWLWDQILKTTAKAGINITYIAECCMETHASSDLQLLGKENCYSTCSWGLKDWQIWDVSKTSQVPNDKDSVGKL